MIRSSRPRRSAVLAALLVVPAVLGAACGDDGGGGLSNEAFCAALEEQDANEDLNLDDPEDLAVFNDLVDQSPDEVRGAMEKFREVTEDFQDLDENDPAALAAVFALMGDGEFLRSLQDLAVFMVDECGLEVEDIDEIRELDPDDPASLFGGLGGTDGFDSGGDVEIGGGDSDPTGDEPSASEELGSFLEENYADAAWADRVVSKAIGSFGSSADITVSLDIESGRDGATDGVAACEAVVEWADGFYSGEVTVSITEFNGDELAGSSDGGPCAPV